MKVIPSNPKIFILIIPFIFSCHAFGFIYKTNAADGSISFSDQPTDGSEKINIKSTNLYLENTVSANNRPNEKNTPTPKSIIAYTQILIQRPKNNQKFNNDEEITAIINIQPKLKKTDHLFLSLDGKIYAVTDKINIELYRGEHIVEAWISNSQQEKLIVSDKIIFFTGKTATLNVSVPM